MEEHESSTLASFLLPDGFRRPGLPAVLREGRILHEAGRYAAAARRERRENRDAAYVSGSLARHDDPVLLVPGFLAGDYSLAGMARSLRRRGYRTYRSHITANVGCTVNAAAGLEARIEAIAIRRDTKVSIVGHSLGGMLARGLAVRRPDLISGVITMGSPMLAPGAHHPALTAGVEALIRLSRAGLPGMMSEDCVAGSCARESFEESRQPMPAGIDFTAIFSKRDGIVDWRACVDPEARQVEVGASHVGMALDPLVIDAVSEALARQRRSRRQSLGQRSLLEVDRGESA
ncbi:lipase family alpha/beta hydrolase [Nocardioides sp.]|uniref:lipase family alpha/beta hydrolase n=1 Tax=Nocardioides sp. TaxID=35761 RepID=UPI00356853C2